MTEVAPAWIASTLIRHHERHGADLDQVISGPFTAQVVKFTALRTEADPHASVEAVLAECAHRVDCVFDAKATDSFERSVAGEPEERLSSNLYAFIRIEEFRIRLRPAEGLPRVVLELLKWDILSNGRRVPPRHRVARDVSDDDRIRLILKAWWTGLSLSSSVPQSSLLRSAPTTQHIASSSSERADLFSPGPVPAAAATMEATEESKPRPADEQPKPRDDIMSRWPQMYKRLYGKGSKGLPGWLFDEPSAEQQQQLESIKVFGLDLERDPIHSQSQPQSQKKGSQSGSGSEEQQQSLTPPLDEDAGPIEVEIPPVSSSQPPLPPPTPPMSSSPAPASAPPSVPSVPPPRHRTPLHPSYSDDEDVPVRPRRRRPAPSTGSETPAPSREPPDAGETSDSELSEYERHRRRIAKGKMRAIEPESNSQSSTSQPINPQPVVESQSLSQSQDSRDFALSRYDVSLSLPPESSTPARPEVGSRSLPPPSRSPGLKRPRYSEEATDSMGPPAAQRLRTEPVSSAWGEGGPPSAQTVFTPVKTEVYTPRTTRQTPVKVEAETPVKCEIREEEEAKARREVEVPKPEPQTPGEAPRGRWEGEGKLGGWRPNLSVRGLNAEYVARVTRVARDMRDRRRVKRESER